MLSSKTFSRVDFSGKYGVEPYLSNFPQDYRIAISPNASTWTDILIGAGSRDVSISFTPVTARYIRIFIKGANFTWAQPWSISEVNVYP